MRGGRGSAIGVSAEGSFNLFSFVENMSQDQDGDNGTAYYLLDTLNDLLYIGFGSHTSGIAAIQLNGVDKVSIVDGTSLKIDELG